MRKQLSTTREMCRPRRKAPSTEYEIWKSQTSNLLEQRISEPTLPGMQGMVCFYQLLHVINAFYMKIKIIYIHMHSFAVKIMHNSFEHFLL